MCLTAGVLNERGRPPRLHDLRHSFAVAALDRWYRQGVDVQNKLPHLATYLGHVSVASTHYYLQLSSELGQSASRRFHHYAGQILDLGRYPLKRQDRSSLALALRAFLTDYLPRQRALSPHTLHSYRDSLKLLLQYVAGKKGDPSQLTMEHLTYEQVMAFLLHLETGRHNQVSSRNVRLSAIRSFFRFVAAHYPEHLALAQRILSAPLKRTTRVKSNIWSSPRSRRFSETSTVPSQPGAAITSVRFPVQH